MDAERRRRREYERAPRLEPQDIEFLQLMLTCEKGIQSGWGNWSISKCAGKTFIRTDKLGRREVPISFEQVEERLREFETKLKEKGIHPTSATATEEVENWLNTEFR